MNQAEIRKIRRLQNYFSRLKFHELMSMTSPVMTARKIYDAELIEALDDLKRKLEEPFAQRLDELNRGVR